MRILFFFLLIISFTCTLNAVQIDSTSYISSEIRSGYFTLTDSDKSAPLLISYSDFPGVIIALEKLTNYESEIYLLILHDKTRSLGVKRFTINK